MTTETKTLTDAQFATLLKKSLTIMGESNARQWKLGDLAASIKTEYAQDTLGRLTVEIQAAGYDLPKTTLANYRTVAKTYSAEERDTGNSFTVYEIFSGKHFADDRMELLRSKVWQASEAKELRKSRIDAARPKPAPSDPPAGDENSPESVETNERAILAARVETLRNELALAESRLAEYDAKHPQTADEPATDEPTEDKKRAQVGAGPIVPVTDIARSHEYVACVNPACKSAKHVAGSLTDQRCRKIAAGEAA
jgi:hypothetical protein